MIWVPPALRGAGAGRRLYEQFERDLPADVTAVVVFAADTDGSGNSDGFWEALGFSYRYTAPDAEDLSYGARHTLIKGVNGHATPAAIELDLDD